MYVCAWVACMILVSVSVCTCVSWYICCCTGVSVKVRGWCWVYFLYCFLSLRFEIVSLSDSEAHWISSTGLINELRGLLFLCLPFSLFGCTLIHYCVLIFTWCLGTQTWGLMLLGWPFAARASFHSKCSTSNTQVLSLISSLNGV